MVTLAGCDVVPRRALVTTSTTCCSAPATAAAMAVVAPLLLAAGIRRLGCGSSRRCCSPRWTPHSGGGRPWGPAQVLVPLVLFRVAGVRDPAAGAAVDVGPQPDPLVAAAGAGPAGPERPDHCDDPVHGGGDRRGQHQFQVGCGAGAGRPDRANRAGAGRRAVLEERTRTAWELHDVVAHHMSLIAVRPRPHVPPQRPARISPCRVRPAERGGPRGAGGDAAAARRAALRPARRAGAAAPAIRPARAVDAARRAGVSVELAVPRTTATCLPAWWCARTGSCGIAVQCQPARARRRWSACRWAMTPGRSCCGWPTGRGTWRAVVGRARMRSRGNRTRARVALPPAPLGLPSACGGFVVSAVLPLGTT